MVDQTHLISALGELVRSTAANLEISDALYRVAEAMTRALDVTGCGVTLKIEDRVRFVTSPSVAIRAIEQAQEAEQAGPCVEAIESSEPTVVVDLADQAGRWPKYAAVAAESNINSVLGIPMRAENGAIGAINVYHETARDWSADEIEVALLIADIASGYVLRSTEMEQSRRTAEQLQTALDSRILIEQAKGVIAASKKISVDQAFELLRTHARSNHAPLRSIADAVVNLGLMPE